jgi:hypothetical protein
MNSKSDIGVGKYLNTQIPKKIFENDINHNNSSQNEFDENICDEYNNKPIMNNEILIIAKPATRMNFQIES